MPVYRNHRVAHLHIPKTAGTTLETQFAELGDMHWNTRSWYGRIKRADRWYEDHHLSLNELRQLSAGDITGMDTFAVVRNPYQRLISEYHWRHALVFGQNAPDLTAFESFDALIAAMSDGDAEHRSLAEQDAQAARLGNRQLEQSARWQPLSDRGPQLHAANVQRAADQDEQVLRQHGQRPLPLGWLRPPCGAPSSPRAPSASD